MFKKFSLAISGLIVIILGEFFPIEEVQLLIQAVGILMSWIGRIRIGDVTLLGTRK